MQELSALGSLYHPKRPPSFQKLPKSRLGWVLGGLGGHAKNGRKIHPKCPPKPSKSRLKGNLGGHGDLIGVPGYASWREASRPLRGAGEAPGVPGGPQ